jgi:Ran GTPase-activating protein (RanGAP) involved in mRNA processing and transport
MYSVVGLCSSSTLSNLDLEENELGEDAGQHLAKILKGCKALAWLRMDGEPWVLESVPAGLSSE